MNKQIAFNKAYFVPAIILFLIEVCIALFIKDSFIRPYGGDFLVVIFIYCLLKSFWTASPLKAGLVVLIFSFTIEFLQYFNFIEMVGLEKSELARFVFGTSFHWADLVAYFFGILAVLFTENFCNQDKSKQ